jgi:NADH:ubiquinone oxidoreductase subunit K
MTVQPVVLPEPMPPMQFQPAASPHDPEEFGFPEPAVGWPSLVRRRRNRMIRFISYEVFALAILVVSAVMGLSHRLPDDPLLLVTKIVTIASAVAVVGIPILFYGLPETLPTNDR